MVNHINFLLFIALISNDALAKSPPEITNFSDQVVTNYQPNRSILNPTNVANWEPSLISDCQADKNQSPVLGLADKVLAQNGARLFEPAIIFSDQTFTLMTRAEPTADSKVETILTWGYFDVTDSDDVSLVYDDGTHGDQIAGDGIFTRACLYMKSEFIGEKDYLPFINAWFIAPKYRGSESVFTIAPGVRLNNSGFFIELGEEYSQRKTNNWKLVSPEYCRACEIAWENAGNVFDFFTLQTRDTTSGAGYVRVHDHIEGTGFNPPCEPNSYCYNIIDGKRHQELIGIIWSGFPGGDAITHELGHALLGMTTTDFPESNGRQWNAGDGMHLDSDTTVTSYLSGPFWDPARGWPYPVVLEDEQGNQTKTYLTRSEQGDFRLKPKDNSSYVWDDILLYMMGLKKADAVDKTYYKLFNPTLTGCVSEPTKLVCKNNLVEAEEIVSFTVNDLIARYGNRKITRGFSPKKMKVGVLNISDRAHTEAEIVWFSKLYREYATSTQARGDWFKDIHWNWSTNGLSTIDIDFVKGKLKPKNGN
ncbi:choice-of-anchor X domain-containing protein [Colwelliaceae bacterium 6471]